MRFPLFHLPRALNEEEACMDEALLLPFIHKTL